MLSHNCSCRSPLTKDLIITTGLFFKWFSLKRGGEIVYTRNVFSSSLFKRTPFPVCDICDLSAFSIKTRVGWVMNDESPKGLRRKQSWHNWGAVLEFAWRDWGKPWKALVRIASVLTEIWTKNFLNTSLECYHYTSLFSLFMIWV
jgi:hypothetical protein